MYRCDLCGRTSQPGQPLNKLTMFKRDEPDQIDRELPICSSCAKRIEAGEPAAKIRAEAISIIEQLVNARPFLPVPVPPPAAPPTQKAFQFTTKTK